MQGRCAGCGAEAPYKASLAHIGRCDKFAVLFRDEPEKALDPAVEFRRVAELSKVEPKAAPKREPSEPKKVRLRSEPSEAPATVAPPKQSTRRSRRAPSVGVEPERVPGPVAVSYWLVPRGLLDGSSS